MQGNLAGIFDRMYFCSPSLAAQTTSLDYNEGEIQNDPLYCTNIDYQPK